jgi:peroxiredoxin
VCAWVAASLLAGGCAGEETAGWLAPPKEAPPFALEDLEGKLHSLEDFRGKPLVVDFWATWCAPCVQQVPVLNRLVQDYGPQGVAVLGISVDHADRSVVADFAQEHQMAYPVLLGDEALAQRYGALGFPALFVIDAEGRIDSVHFGVASWDELEGALSEVR